MRGNPISDVIVRTVETTDVLFITRLMMLQVHISGGQVTMNTFNSQFLVVNFLFFGGSRAWVECSIVRLEDGLPDSPKKYTYL